MGLAEALTLVFVCAKLFGAITWLWIWVLCPLWIIYGLILVVLLCALLLCALQEHWR